MRDPSITNEAIDKWLYDCILKIILGGVAAEGMVGIVEINNRTILGHLWVRFRVDHQANQKTPAFQFFFRLDEAAQGGWTRQVTQHMLDNAVIKLETKAGRERFVMTTALDELAKLADG